MIRTQRGLGRLAKNVSKSRIYRANVYAEQYFSLKNEEIRTPVQPWEFKLIAC